MAVRTYDARVERGERYWVVHVPQIDRVTQARNLNDVEMMTRDLIALMEEVPSDSFEVRFDIQLPRSVQERLELVERFQAEASEAQSRAAAERRLAAEELAATGMSLRDVGRALGISHQRAHQLLRRPG